MQSSSCSPKKKLIRKPSKASPAKPKIHKAKSLILNKGSLSLFSYDQIQENKSIEDLQNSLQKLSHNDKLYELQSITIEQLKKICNFVNDKKSVSKLQVFIEEQKVGEMSTGQVQNRQNHIDDIEEMLQQKGSLDIDIRDNIWESDVGLAQIQEPITQPWWLKQQDYGDRLDLF